MITSTCSQEREALMPGLRNTTVLSPALPVALLLTAAALPVAAAQDIGTAPVIYRSGDWAVHRTQDLMTDANICTAIYRENADIQLGSHSLVIAIADGTENITLRFDNEPARATRQPKRTEWSVSAIDIEGADFTYLLQSKRLRYRVLTSTANVVEGDIDLNGAKDAYNNIQAGCVGDPVTDGAQ
jgi:hypothetical protein